MRCALHLSSMNVQTILALFHAFVRQPSNRVRSFVMSDDARALNVQRGQYDYPQLQLDPPRFAPELLRGRQGKKVYRTTAAILAPAATDDWQAQDRVTEAMEREIDHLISWLERRRGSQGLRVSGLGECYPIRMSEPASLFGWALPVTLSVTQAFCVSASALHQVVYLWPAFTEGESELQIEVDGTLYTSPWGRGEDLPFRLDDLARKVNAGGHPLTAARYLDSLVLTSTVPGQAILPIISAGDSGHAFTNLSL